MELLLILYSLALLLTHYEKYMYCNPVNNGTVINLIFRNLSVLILAHDEKYVYGNPVNSGTVINLICVGLSLSP